MMTELNKIIDLVRKLDALSTSSNPNEAARAAEKAQELLLKYNLDRAQVEATEFDADIERSDIRAGDSTWQLSLIGAIARTNLCRVVRTKGSILYKSGVFHVFGRKGNVEVVVYLYHYLTREIIRLSNEVSSDRSFGAAFRMGAVAVIEQRLTEGMSRFQSQSEQSRALVIISDKAVNERVNREFPNLKNAKARGIADYAGYTAGQLAGARIPIHQGLTHQGKQERLK